MKVRSSISEIVRVGGWALRGAGFPFGVAERGTRMLAFAEAVHGGAVRAVCAQEELIAEAARLETTSHRRLPDGTRQVDGAGRHLIEIGPPLADLATSDARHTGVGIARAIHVHGFVFASAIADLLARRGLAGLCVYRAPESEQLPAGLKRSGWILFGKREAGAIFASGEKGGPLGCAIEGALGGSPGGAALAADLAAIASPGPGFLTLTAIGPDLELAARLLALFDRPGAEAALADYSGRLAQAYREGVPMNPQDLQDLYDLEIRTWAPTSERSRSQAGYGKF